MIDSSKLRISLLTLLVFFMNYSATVLAETRAAETNKHVSHDTEFPIALLPSEFSYFRTDKQLHELKAVIEASDPAYKAIKNYFEREAHDWSKTRSDLEYIGDGYITSESMSIVCSFGGEGVIVSYLQGSMWVTIEKDIQTPCEMLSKTAIVLKWSPSKRTAVIQP